MDSGCFGFRYSVFEFVWNLVFAVRPKRSEGTLPQANVYPAQRADVELGILTS
jgi:hypothetical protein